MIKINSFSPVDNFTRRTREFHDDRIVVKTKSLTADYENEIRYEKIKEIRSKRSADLGWLWASFIVIAILGLAKMGLGYFCTTNPIIQVIEKAVVIFAFVLLLPAFRKHEYYSFLADKYYLATIRVDDKSKQSMLEAINLIKQKTAITSETYFTDSFPSAAPVFQFTEFDFPDFLNKAQVRFYEDRLIGVEKSLAEKATTTIKYDDFSGKTKIIKVANDKWDYVWSYWLMFVCLMGISIAVFFPKQVSGNVLYLRLFFGGLILLIPLFLLRYIKSELLVFYDSQDDGIFWATINPKNREKLNQIAEFVQGKVARKKIKPA